MDEGGRRESSILQMWFMLMCLCGHYLDLDRRVIMFLAGEIVWN